MKPLELEFAYDGFQWRQLDRVGDVVLLEKSKPSYGRASYEVIIVQIHPEQTIHGRHYPERETMPRSEAWGELGWTYTDRPSAEVRFRHLVNRRTGDTFTPPPFPRA